MSRTVRPPSGRLSMMRMATNGAVVFFATLGCALHAAAAFAAPVRYGDQDAELSVSTIGERTVQVLLAPLDEKGKPRPAPPSTVLVAQQPELRLHCRELTEAREVAAGRLRVRVKP